MLSTTLLTRLYLLQTRCLHFVSQIVLNVQLLPFKNLLSCIASSVKFRMDRKNCKQVLEILRDLDFRCYNFFGMLFVKSTSDFDFISAYVLRCARKMRTRIKFSE
jgi:hypothetical protein